MLGVVVFVLGAWSDPSTAWRILPAKRYYDNDGPWLVCELQVFAYGTTAQSHFSSPT